MKKVLMRLTFILTPVFGMALAMLIIDPFWSNHKTLEVLITVFASGGILIILCFLVSEGSLNLG
ncbi:hypothetical protein GLW07_08810 [Bacillus hwajinpoensis]|uniref:Uncharacterized protein n=1 Tax=Guptibacillus hwajinpoensis TaxID=208199 RepID=A0A845EXY8_9BACL|nr:hypothetical protein [Pseudalkalibacillus hwajinpoensis]MYL63452.1 hypothetical protein [Pseudalkalibacillus hwajinpoensis]